MRRQPWPAPSAPRPPATPPARWGILKTRPATLSSWLTAWSELWPARWQPCARMAPESVPCWVRQQGRSAPVPTHPRPCVTCIFGWLKPPPRSPEGIDADINGLLGNLRKNYTMDAEQHVHDGFFAHSAAQEELGSSGPNKIEAELESFFLWSDFCKLSGQSTVRFERHYIV